MYVELPSRYSAKVEIPEPQKTVRFFGRRFFQWQIALMMLAAIPVGIGAEDIGARIVRHFEVPTALDTRLFSGTLPAATASTSAGFVPTHLWIPSIGVDAAVEAVGLKADGSVGTPSSFNTTAWYDGGPKAGAPGNAIIDGHVNNALTTAGVFEHLDQLQVGDTVTVGDGKGKTAVFQVSSEQLYGIDDAPLGEIFTATGTPQLVLITCNGAWDSGKKEYDKRLVIYATLSK